MSRKWFATPLETVATWWRVLRHDGITLGFTSHDRDLWIDGVLHLASPGMIPSSIRRSSDFQADSAEVDGVLSHDAISAEDLAMGRFDGARVRVGLVDWESGDSEQVYTGSIGAITQQGASFTAELASRKAELAIDPTPRTSPSCRAAFCGPGCQLSGALFTHEAVLVNADQSGNAITVSMTAASADCIGGEVGWFDGPLAGMRMRVSSATSAGTLVLDTPIVAGLAAGARLSVREGCDHTLDTCATRFANAVNFQGEPYLPGNDLLMRYPTPAQ